MTREPRPAGARERHPQPDEERREFREEEASLARITLGPVVWAAHFLLCYCSVALFCAKGWPTGPLYPVLAGASLAALAAIAWLALRALRQWDVHRHGQLSQSGPDAETRHQFLGHAAFLLAVMSAIGVVYVSMPLLMIEACE